MTIQSEQVCPDEGHELPAEGSDAIQEAKIDQLCITCPAAHRCTIRGRAQFCCSRTSLRNRRTFVLQVVVRMGPSRPVEHEIVRFGTNSRSQYPAAATRTRTRTWRQGPQVVMSQGG